MAISDASIGQLYPMSESSGPATIGHVSYSDYTISLGTSISSPFHSDQESVRITCTVETFMTSYMFVLEATND